MWSTLLLYSKCNLADVLLVCEAHSCYIASIMWPVYCCYVKEEQVQWPQVVVVLAHIKTSQLSTPSLEPACVVAVRIRLIRYIGCAVYTLPTIALHIIVTELGCCVLKSVNQTFNENLRFTLMWWKSCRTVVQGCKRPNLKKAQPCGFYCFLGFYWVLGFRVKPGFF